MLWAQSELPLPEQQGTSETCMELDATMMPAWHYMSLPNDRYYKAVIFKHVMKVIWLPINTPRIGRFLSERSMTPCCSI